MGDTFSSIGIDTIIGRIFMLDCTLAMSMLFEQINDEGWARTYFITDEETMEAVIVDPVWDNLERDLATISDRGLTLRAVIGTHTHADHISAAWRMVEEVGCDFIMHMGASTHGVSKFVSDGDSYNLGSIVFTFHSATGHTTDSMIVEIPGHLMTGDFLFNGEGGTGRDDLPGGSLETHWEALQVLSRFGG